MSLEQKVIQWASTRDPWQRHILRRIAQGESLGDEDYNRIVDAILESDQFSDEKLRIEDLPSTSDENESVKLISIEDPKHVNAISSSQPLTVAREGITIVYGDNGTGKSGYARLMKRLARARHKEKILSDVFRDSSQEEPRAHIKLLVGEKESSLTGPISSLQEVRGMIFYDKTCGDAYISTESDFPYRPASLFVLDGLLDACTSIRNLVDARLAENGSKKRPLPVVDNLVSDTDAGRFLSSLSGESSIEILDAIIKNANGAKGTLDQLNMQEARLISGDTRQEKIRLTRDGEKMEAIADHLEKIQERLSSEVVLEIIRLSSEVQTLEEATSLLASAFESEPLEGIGSTAWEQLWSAAKQYSVTHAYPGDVFPVLDANCRCVFCMQPLTQEGRDRFKGFEQFVRDDSQRQLAEVSEKLEISKSKILNLSAQTDAANTRLSDLEVTHPKLISITRKKLAEADYLRDVYQEAFANSSELTSVQFDCGKLINELRETAMKTKREAIELSNPNAVIQRLDSLRIKKKEMLLANQMNEQRSVIVDEINRLKLHDRLVEIKDSAATGAITRKLSELSEAEVTEVIRDRFTREADRLQLERVTISKTRAEKKALLHQPKLVGARQQVTLPRVFSEGEKTALGLAAFFTEAYLDGSESTLILDDPVSSLDHVRRGLVANRIVELSQGRQIIVFTHDVSLVADLKREAAGKGVVVTDRSVERSRGSERKPGACGEKHPWKAKDVTERLVILRQKLAEIKKEYSAWEEDRYETEVAVWAGNLSETWERIFSQEVVGPILAEGGVEVRPKMVKVLAQFSEDDNALFQASYSRVSQWAKRHDKAGAVNYVAPEVRELENEIDLVDGWFKRVRKYKS